MGTAQGEALPIVLYLTFLTDVAGPSFLSVTIIIYVSIQVIASKREVSDTHREEWDCMWGGGGETWSAPEVHAALAAFSS